MAFTLATWNINSVRLRESIVSRLMSEEMPDILCLQECKCLAEQIPTEAFEKLGYRYRVARGQKSYNGVAILSKLPMVDAGGRDFATLGHARHVAGQLENGVTIHNFYVPAGGDIPDREENVKFGQKLDFLTEMRDHFRKETPDRAILVGDLNIAPLEDDVWSHKQLLDVVSHTPIETESLEAMRRDGGWVDLMRQAVPASEKLYTWWSYRAADWAASDRGRRLDHVWSSPGLAPRLSAIEVLREARGWERPSDHVPVIARFDLG